MPGTPRIRRGVAKAVLAVAEQLPAPERSALMADVTPETMFVLRDGLGLSWISGYDYHALVNALFRILQAERFRSFYTHVYLSLAELPILSSITQTALRMGFSTPLGLARYAPPTWRHLADEMGHLQLITDVGSSCVRCTGYPTHLGPPEIFMHAFAGTCDGFYALCQIDEKVEIRDVNLATGDASFWLHD